MPTILAVIVTYQPRADLLTLLLQALAPQVQGGIVVNNGTTLPLSDDALTAWGFQVHHVQRNTGVATALNIGFDWAAAQGADFVLSFDQDSQPAPDMVARLLSAYTRLVADGQRIGAVGPQQVDSRSARIAPHLAPIHGIRRNVTPRPFQTIEVDHLISSGCLLPLTVYQQVGPFIEALFIDYVDIEWSLRLRHRGWHLYAVGGALLQHTIGDHTVDFWGRQIPMHTPQRHYYLMRNGVYLQRLAHIPFGWKWSDAIQLLKKFIFFSLVERPRWAHFRAMVRGVRDGLCARLGP